MGHGGENRSQLSFTSWLLCTHLSRPSDPVSWSATPSPLLLVDFCTSGLDASQLAQLQLAPFPAALTPAPVHCRWCTPARLARAPVQVAWACACCCQ